MLRKKTALTILFLCLTHSLQTWAKWEEYKVQAIINSNEYLLGNGQHYIIKDLTFPNFNKERLESSCFINDLRIFLRENLKQKIVLIEQKNEYKRIRNRPFYIQGDIKTKKPRINLKNLFVSQGWAKAPIKNSKFEKVQQEAIKNQKGYWGACTYSKELSQIKEKNGNSYFFKNKKHFIKNTSIGWVKEVIDSNKVLLYNGVTIQISNIKSVNLGDDQVNKCINDSTKNYLTSLLLNKKVVLEKENIQLLGSKTLVRHVWISKTKHTSKSLISEKLIKNGLAFVEKSKNDKYLPRLKKAEKETYQKMPNSWIPCLKNLEITDIVTNPMEKVLMYDPKCPIKGNVSGSKKNPKKTYHTPLSGWYNRLDPEKCFKSEQKATEARFVKVK